MTEIEQMLSWDYEQCWKHLHKKYGLVPKNYFTNESYTSKTQKIGRGNEGLYIHHIDEDKGIMLSTKEFAQLSPFEWQKADRLVYCNLLEHLVLHIKIVEYPQPKPQITPDGSLVNPVVGVGGIYSFIVPELNDIYSGVQYKQPWKQKVCEVVLPLKNDYFKCISKLVEMNLPYHLLTFSIFNYQAGIWQPQNNQELWEEMMQLGVQE